MSACFILTYRRGTAWSLALAALALALAAPALAQTTNRPAGRDYRDFQVVADRNIFNQHRYARSTSGRREVRRTVQADYVALVGIMSYEKGPFAFFDGSFSDARKVLKLGDVIAGYRLTALNPGSVTLKSETNQLQLRVGMQLRREPDGPWQVAAAPEPGALSRAPVAASRPTFPAAPATPVDATPPANGDSGQLVVIDPGTQTVLVDPPTDTAGTNAVPDTGGGDDAVLRRLMQRREQEINR